jgi:hypothetical protein
MQIETMAVHCNETATKMKRRRASEAIPGPAHSAHISTTEGETCERIEPLRLVIDERQVRNANE